MPAKKPAKPTRLQVKADKKDKVLTGPKGSKPQSTTTNRVRTQGGKPTTKPNVTVSPSYEGGRLRVPGTEGKVNKPAGRRTNPKAAKPAAAPAKPAAKPQMVNSNSATMRQIQAKAAAARARAQGKPAIKGPINPPNSARAGKDLIKQGAQRLRTIGDSGQVRAAAEQGRKAMEAAQRNRARRAAGVGRGAKELQAVARVAGLARGLSPATVAYETLKARPTADGTLTAAQSGRAPSRFANARDLAMKKASAIKGSPVVGPKKSAAGQFDSAFAAARKAGKKAFTFKGKKYTTEMK